MSATINSRCLTYLIATTRLGLAPQYSSNIASSLSLVFSLLQLSGKTLVYCSLFALKLFTIVAPNRKSTFPRSACFSVQTGQGINNISCTPRPCDRPSIATEIAWYGHQIDKPVLTQKAFFFFFLTSHTGLCKGRDQSSPPFSPGVTSRSLDF